LLVVGASGAVGAVLAEVGVAHGDDVHGTHLHGVVPAPVQAHRLDVREGYAVQELIGRLRPDVVVTTAYRQDDWSTTAAGPAHVALACASVGARLVHVSSDVVFDGSSPTVAEDATPHPVSDYGRAKLAAEQAVTELVPEGAVVRTSLVLGSSAGRPSPMERLVHDLASGEGDGVLFTDDVRCPVHVHDLAEALHEIAHDGMSGVLHCAGPDAVSRHEIGLLVAARDGLDPALLRPGSRAASGVPGPLDVRLDSSRTRAQLTTRLRGAREFLAS
jgi:dTDP-4-dehydrorhamnose reductase